MDLSYTFLGTGCLMVFLMACDTNDCDDCLENREPTARIEVRITIDDEQESVPVTFYEEEKAEGNEVATVLAEHTREEYTIETDVDYIAVAEYYRDGDTIAVVDETSIYLNESDDCRSPCYMPDQDNADLRFFR